MVQYASPSSDLQIFGTFKSASFDYSNLPNFYQIYSATNGKHGKPMAIPETGALWDLDAIRGGAPTELQVKSTWWQQVWCCVIENGCNLSIARQLSEGPLVPTACVKVAVHFQNP